MNLDHRLMIKVDKNEREAKNAYTTPVLCQSYN